MQQLYRQHPSDIHLLAEVSPYPLPMDGHNTVVLVSRSAYERNPGVAAHIPDGATVHVRDGGLPNECEIDTLPVDDRVTRVIGIGGGSVMDVAKVYTARLACRGHHGAGMLVTDASLLNGYWKRRQEIELRLIPSLLGSSAELTRWSSLWSPEDGRKTSLVHHFLYADRVVYDPDLCASADARAITITALDCLAHAVEACWHPKFNFISDHHALAAIRLSVSTLAASPDWRQNAAARVSLAHAAAFGGLAFAQDGTSIAHALSYPLTSAGLDHGLASSMFLGKLLDRLSASRPDMHAQIATIFTKHGFPSTTSLDAAYRAFYARCGAARLLAGADLTALDPSMAADSARTYDKFDNSLIKLTRSETVALYSQLSA